MKNEKLNETIAYQLKAGLQMRQFGLDFGIYDHENKQVFILNPIAGLIFNYLPTGKSYDEIVENIIIACGKNTTKPNVIKNDLEKTVKEFINLKILEPVETNTSYQLKEPLIISEHEMTSLSIPYLQPQIKTYSMEDLLKRTRSINDKKVGNDKNAKGIVVNFLDTWNPKTIDVRFSDTWSPNTGKVSFSDTWNPNSIVVRFSDTWNPNSGKVSFSDTWNPTKINPEEIEKTKPITIPNKNIKSIKSIKGKK